MNRALPSFSVRRPVATAMLFLGIALVGGVSLTRLPVNLLPDVSFPTLVVSTDYPDAAPAEVERHITVPLEQRLAQVGGVRRVTSRSRQGHSRVRLTFAWGTDMQFAALDVRERLDEIRSGLPRSAGRPTILSTDPSDDPILTLAVTGADPGRLREISETVIERRLEQLEGVSLAAVTGGPRPEIHVTVEPERLAAYGVTMDEVRRALDAANYSAPGGQIQRRRYHYTLRTLGEFQSVADIRRVAIRAAGSSGQGGGASAADDGGGGASPVRVSDIAAVESGTVERRTMTRYDGEPAVGLEVFKASGANTIRVDGRVEEVLGQLRTEYPELDLRMAHSQAGFVRDAIRGALQALAAGGLLAFAVLFFFLRDPRYPLAVGVAIPTSVAAALALFYLFDVSLNVMSLGGLALAVGMLVDNSIVVLENIFRHREEGRPAEEAAVAGTEEVGAAINASTLTTIAVFGPVLYVEGVAGTLFEELSLSVAFALLASLLAALALLPGLTVRVPGSTTTGGTTGAGPAEEWRPLEAFRRSFDRFSEWYERALEWSLDHRGVVLAGAAVTLAGAAALGAALPRSLMPAVDERALRIELELPVGSPLEETAGAARRAERLVRGLPGAPSVFTRVGRPPAVQGGSGEVAGEHVALLRAELPPAAPSSRRAARRIRRSAGAAGLDPSALMVRPARSTSLGQAVSMTDADVVVEARGQDLDSLYATAGRARDRLRETAGLTDVRVEGTADQPTLTVEVDRAAADRHGIPVERVASMLRDFAAGARTERPFTRFAERVPIRVRLPDEANRTLGSLLDLRVRDVPLRQLVRVRSEPGPVEIRREGQTRVVRVLAGVDGGLASAVETIRGVLAGMSTAGETRLRVGGANERMRESFTSLLQAFGLALVLVYLILAAQFESLRHPFVILAAVPLAAIGALGALRVAGSGISVISGIGVVVLIGIVVNDAIVKVDFINQRRRAGLGLRPAIVEAGRLRLRPIVMTTATTVFGLLPLALGWGAGADLRAPLAIAVVGGLISSTVLTLLVVPVLYGAIARRE